MSLLSPRELAERLGVSVDTVYRHASEWPCVRIGNLLRFDLDQVVAFRADHAQQVDAERRRRQRGPRMRVEPQWRIRADRDHRRRGVYFMQGQGGGLIKIGFSLDPGRRLEEHQEGSPVLLRILAVMRDATVIDERDLHQRFRDSRVHGEWFEPTPELLSLIDSVKQVVAA